MANVLINEDSMTAIANAIRTKKGVSTKYKPADMPSAISSITPTGTKSITANGTYDVTTFASADVNVPTSGGSGGTVLETGSLGASRSFQLDMKASWFENHDLIIIHISGTVSAPDWIYMAFNNTTGADYSNQVSSFDWYGVADRFVITQTKAMFSSNRSTALSANAQYLYLYTYNSSNTITGTYEIIGYNVL